MEKVRAVALLSGGLDSSLAIRLVQKQGVEVKALHFYTGFCTVEHKRRLGTKTGPNPALRAAAQLGVPLEIIDISEEYYDIVLNPKFGYGRNVNPCIDCRVFMLKKAKEIMEREGYHFVITGEVLWQRPMSQTPDRLKLIEREAGLEGYVLRPLSAKALSPTVPEIKGWVDREALMGIVGRSRKKQIALAKELGIEDYEQPAGGCCYLTDENYAYRFREAFAVEGKVTKEDLILFAVGRHLRLTSGIKLIIARNEGEVNFLKGFKDRYGYAYRKDGKGTFALIKGEPPEEELQTIANIIARYSKRQECNIYMKVGNKEFVLKGVPVEDELLDRFKIYSKAGAVR
ncbi:MAG TPA: hypothetical protein EYP11_02490 [Aquificaceae bacterium]|nr:hypothetical protein [Aquificaceae bacterium]HIQ30537.1 hypothetical protein [Aquifex aeolicus]